MKNRTYRLELFSEIAGKFVEKATVPPTKSLDKLKAEVKKLTICKWRVTFFNGKGWTAIKQLQGNASERENRYLRQMNKAA